MLGKLVIKHYFLY